MMHIFINGYIDIEIFSLAEIDIRPTVHQTNTYTTDLQSAIVKSSNNLSDMC